MKTSCLVLVFALALAASASPVEETRHQKELREHYHHLSYIADYSCHHPQARAVPVETLLSHYQTRGKAFFPQVTVLHQCDMFAGCCEGPKKCGPLHAEIVRLPFKVTYLEDMGHHHKGEWEMEYFTFDNHTVCGCGHDGYTPPHHDHEHEHEHDKPHHSHEDHDDRKDHRKPHGSHEDHDDHYRGTSHRKGGSDSKPVYEARDQQDDARFERRPENSNRKIDSLYITI